MNPRNSVTLICFATSKPSEKSGDVFFVTAPSLSLLLRRIIKHKDRGTPGVLVAKVSFRRSRYWKFCAQDSLSRKKKTDADELLISSSFTFF